MRRHGIKVSRTLPPFILVLLTVLASIGDVTAPTARAAEQPNIIFILTDDMRADELADMPYLQEALVGAGTTFTNAFVTTPICCPSRASILRGQYTHNHGIWSNKPVFLGEPSSYPRFHATGQEESTVATWLHDAGYHTGLIGLYLKHYADAASPEYVPPGWDEWRPQVRGRYFGFHMIEHGLRVKYSRRAGDYATDIYRDKAINFITRATESGQPFFLYLGLLAPHDAAVPATRHADALPGATAPRGPGFNESDVSDKPRRIQSLPVLNDEAMQQIDANSRARRQTLLAVDEMIAALDETLKETGAFDNTFVVFTSDNGFLLGEHRFRNGKGAPYDEAIKVPLVIRGPGVAAGRVEDRLVTLSDLAPTFADLAGATPGNFVDGRSLVPLLRGDLDIDWRQMLLVEYRWPEPGSLAGVKLANTPAPDPVAVPTRIPKRDVAATQAAEEDAESAENDAVDRAEDAEEEKTPPFRVLVTPDLRYIEHQTGEVELYDIVADPAEIENIASATPAEEIDRLSAALAALATCAADSCRAAEDAGIG